MLNCDKYSQRRHFSLNLYLIAFHSLSTNVAKLFLHVNKTTQSALSNNKAYFTLTPSKRPLNFASIYVRQMSKGTVVDT